MAVTQIYVPDEIRKAINIIHPDGELFEVRLLEAKGKRNYSGYFRSPETLLDALRAVERLDEYNMYLTLNKVKESCYSRDQRDRFLMNTKNQTSDIDIEGYNYLFVDIDPVRPAGISSDAKQLEMAKNRGNAVYYYLNGLGFEKPLIAHSGNGVHLLYKVHLANSDTNKTLIQDCLRALDMMFSDEYVCVDRANFNPARICKLYGTLAHKGSNTEENPHRQSRILDGFQQGGVTDVAYLRKLIEVLPKEEKPMRYNRYNPSEFDLESWLGKYGIGYRASAYADGTKYILDHCPFNENHKGKDAAVFKMRTGAISFKCLHNSCQDKKWADFRVLLEPDAYERKNQQYEKIAYRSHNRNNPDLYVPKEKKIDPVEGKPIFYTALDVYNEPKKEDTFIRTGFKEIDRTTRGLIKGGTSVWTGLRASAKSTALSCVCLNAIEDGNNVGVYSGELSRKRFMNWMNQQAAGKSRVEQGKYEGFYNVPDKYQKMIADWMGERFWIYNNDYGNNFEALIDEFEKKIVDSKLDLLMLDNLMSIDITGLADTKNEMQTAFAWKLHKLAETYNVHIAYVAHPKKALGLLRLDDISGSADLGNAVDLAFIVHRNNNDFKRLSAQMFGWKESEPIYEGTNVIEVAKDRDGGTQDLFVPLWYEPESKRLKNSYTENIIYGWDNDDWRQINENDPVFD